MSINDIGPEPQCFDLESATLDNSHYRAVAWSGRYLQLTLMSIPVGEDVGLEAHPETDQFLRLDAGRIDDLSAVHGTDDAVNVDGAGLGHLLTYTGITILACIGYGAFFLVVGLFIRNPIIPAIVLYGWEWLNFLLPPLLKKISVIHYLHSLVPIPVSEGPFAVVAEPTPAWIAVPSLIMVTIVVLVIASLRIRHMEIRYGSD